MSDADDDEDDDNNNEKYNKSDQKKILIEIYFEYNFFLKYIYIY